MKLYELLRDMEYKCEDKSLLKKDVVDLKIDNREIKTGDVFIALKGNEHNGNDYIEQAMQSGAVAVISDEKGKGDIEVPNARLAYSLMSKNYFERKCDDMKIVAVTGTNGKTSICNITADILRGTGKKIGVIGTLGAEIDGEFIDTGFTTPDPYILHSIFKNMYDKGVKYVVMEASAHAIALNKLEGIKFEVSVLTNITEDHLDFFGTMDNYANAKIGLFNSQMTKVGLYCSGKNYVKTLLEKSNIPLFSYGFSEDCDYKALIKEKSFDGTRFEIIDKKNNKFDIKTPLIGQFNIENTLSAFAICKRLGLNDNEILQGINEIKPVEGRFNIIKNGDVNIVVDFAHTPDGLEKVLKTAKDLAKGKIVAIFGCGGNRDRLKRPIMGEIASRYADEVILTSDNPRYEIPIEIIKEIKKGVNRDCLMIENRKEAIEHALKNFVDNETIIIAGKGAEKYQEINGVKYPYNDFDVIEKFLKNNK